MPVISFWVVLVVLALATARITGLITSDDITADLRNRIIYRKGSVDHPRGLIADLIRCQWCVSIWVAIVVVTVAWFGHSHISLFLIALVLAFSQITGMLSKLGRS